MKGRLLVFVAVFFVSLLVVYAAKQVGPVFLNLPKTDPMLEVYSTFNITCSYIQAGTGSPASADIYFEFNTSGDNFVNITETTLFNTTNTNPATGVPTNSNRSINVTVRDVGKYSVRCGIVDINNAGIINTTVNQTVTVSDTKSPSVDILYPINGTSFESNSSLNVSISGAVSDNFKVDFVFVNITSPSGQTFSLSLSNKTSLSYYNVSFVNRSLGRYNLTLFANDSSNNINVSNAFFYINDTLTPRIDFGVGVEANNSNFTRDFIFVNITVTEANPANITFTLYNVTSLVNRTIYYLGDLFSNLSINFTNLAYGYYFYNVSVSDTANNRNQTFTRSINLTSSTLLNLGDTVPPQVTITNPQNITYTTSFINFNFSINESGTCHYSLDNGLTNYSMTPNVTNTGFNGANISIADGSYIVRAYCNDTAGNLNGTTTVIFSKDTTPPLLILDHPRNITYLATDLSINYSVTDTNLQSCWYTDTLSASNITLSNCNNVSYSVAQGSTEIRLYANDSLGNINSSSVTFFVDSVLPVISFGSGTQNDGANVTRDFIFVNVTLIETNFKNITFILKNATSIVNTTIYISQILSVNFTGLAFGRYYYNVSVFDVLGNFNSTQQRAINLSNTTTQTIGDNLGGPSSSSASVPDTYFINNSQQIRRQEILPNIENIKSEQNNYSKIDLEPIYPYIQELFTLAREDILEMRRQDIGTNKVDTLFEEAYNAFLVADYKTAELKLVEIHNIKQKAFFAREALGTIKRNPLNLLTGAATIAYENEDYDFVIRAASTNTWQFMIFLSNLMIFFILAFFVFNLAISRKYSIDELIRKRRKLKMHLSNIIKNTFLKREDINRQIKAINLKIKKETRLELRKLEKYRKEIKGKIKKCYNKEKRKEIIIDKFFKRKEHSYIERIKELNNKINKLNKIFRKNS